MEWRKAITHMDPPLLSLLPFLLFQTPYCKHKVRFCFFHSHTLAMLYHQNKDIEKNLKKYLILWNISCKTSALWTVPLFQPPPVCFFFHPNLLFYPSPSPIMCFSSHKMLQWWVSLLLEKWGYKPHRLFGLLPVKAQFWGSMERRGTEARMRWGGHRMDSRRGDGCLCW